MGYVTVMDAKKTVVDAPIIALTVGTRVLVLGVDMVAGRFFGTEVVGHADLDCQGPPLFVSRQLSAQRVPVFAVDENGVVWQARQAVTATFVGKSFSNGLGCTNADVNLRFAPRARRRSEWPVDGADALSVTRAPAPGAQGGGDQ